MASSLVVKDGKFLYVGNEAGLSAYEGEITDLGGKFIMPGIIDSHVHVTMAAAFEYAELGVSIIGEGKQKILDFMSAHIQNNPGRKCYRFMLDKRLLDGTELVKEDLDAVCPDSELIIIEDEMHSCWVNSKVLALHGINDDTPDPIPGLSYYVRKDGHVTGNVGGRPIELWTSLLGKERASKMYRCKTLWNSGALVTWSSDEIFYTDFTHWSPYLAMEVGMTRWINEKTKMEEESRTVTEFPPASEKMSIEEMILGYTINGAKQLGIEDSKGSIEAGKDADFLVFDNDLLTAEHEGFSHNKPSEVFICGEKVN